MRTLIETFVEAVTNPGTLRLSAQIALSFHVHVHIAQLSDFLFVRALATCYIMFFWMSLGPKSAAIASAYRKKYGGHPSHSAW